MEVKVGANEWRTKNRGMDRRHRILGTALTVGLIAGFQVIAADLPPGCGGDAGFRPGQATADLQRFRFGDGR